MSKSTYARSIINVIKASSIPQRHVSKGPIACYLRRTVNLRTRGHPIGLPNPVGWYPGLIGARYASRQL